jgi:release factor glutamine methyltransferase
MKVSDWLATAQQALTDASIATARLDALVLLENATGTDRAQLLAHPDDDLKPATIGQLADQLERRLQHEPLAYILGYTEFYGRRFTITPDVLEPRPESETMIDLLKKLAPRGAQVADIGTGSGALAITAALETGAAVCAVDIDEACLTVAAANAVSHTTPLLTLRGDLLEPFLAGSETDFVPQVLLTNLPYVPDSYQINTAALHEPRLAIFGGPDGLDLFRRMFEQATQLPVKPTLILTESLPPHHGELASIAHSAGYRQQVEDDFIQAFVPEKTV